MSVRERLRRLRLLERPAAWTLTASLIVMFASPLIGPAEDRLFDFGLGLRKDPGWPAGLVGVRIDDATVRESGRWPWPRSRLAELVDALRTYGPRTLVLDLLLAGSQDPKDDLLLATRLDGVLLSAGRGAKSGVPAKLDKHLWRPGAARVPPIRADEIVLPAALFDDAAGGVGHTIYLAGGDRRVRTQIPLLAIEGSDDAYLPSVALLATVRHAGIPADRVRLDAFGLVLGDRRVPLYGGATRISIARNATPPVTVSALDVLRGTGLPELRDAIAVVYVDTADSPDRVATLASPVTPGGVVVLESIRVLQGGAAPGPIARQVALFAALVLVLFAGRRMAHATPDRVLLATLIAIVATFVIALVLIRGADRLLPALHVNGFFVAAGVLHAYRTGKRMQLEQTELRALLEAAKSIPVTTARTVPSDRDPTESRAPSPELPLKLRFGRYGVECKIGEGGMGAVFLAFDDDLKRHVALKILTGATPSALSRFRREAAIVGQISHPNVVQIFDVALSGETPYLVMEFCKGGTLSERVDRGGLSFEDGARLIASAARGLGAAHARRIVHRDVKPSNVLLASPNGTEAKVGDFGIAKLIGDAGPTQAGHVIGTFSYMSPEQASGKPIDSRSDVFSLGLTWYRIIVGRAAFSGTPSEIVSALLTREAPTPVDDFGRLPPWIVEVYRRMTARDPDARFANGTAVAEEIERYIPKASIP